MTIQNLGLTTIAQENNRLTVLSSHWSIQNWTLEGVVWDSTSMGVKKNKQTPIGRPKGTAR